MIKKIIFLLCIIAISIILVIKLMSFLHELEINTATPQASSSLEESKKNNFFIKEYKVLGDKEDFFKVKEAWVEFAWKYQLRNGKKTMKRFNEIQLVMKLSNFNSEKIREGDYLVNWQIDEISHGTVGSGNYVYDLSLSSIELPDTLTFFVKDDLANKNPHPTVIKKFFLIKK